MFQQIIHLGLVVLASLHGKQDYFKIIYSVTICGTGLLLGS